MSKLARKKINRNKNKSYDYHIGSIIVILLIGLLSFVYVGSTLIELQQNRQVLGATSEQSK